MQTGEGADTLEAGERNLWRFDEDGQIQLDFHPGQARAWLSKARFVFMLAGTQGGKTSFGPW